MQTFNIPATVDEVVAKHFEAALVTRWTAATAW
jgi:hypothetical protein